MTSKPSECDTYLLLGFAQKSRVGFSIPVECSKSFDPEPGQPRSKATVWVILPDGQMIVVTRGDLEPAS
jgi:hypothetical protein